MIRIRFLAAGFLLLLSAAIGCKTGDPRTTEKKVAVDALFMERAHPMSSCMKGLAASYLETQDSVLWFDRDSTLRIKVPSMPGCENYHAHLGQMVGGQKCEQVFHQNNQGVIEIPLGRYSDPETLIITSAAFEIRQTEVPARIAKANPEAKPEAGISPPYIVSYKLLPAETAEAVISLQHFRLDVTTPVGPLHILPTPFNRTQQIITIVDPTRKLWDLMKEDPYVTIAKYDVAIVPRLMVEVVGQEGRVWERTGTWDVPTGLDRFFKPGEKPFVIRSDEHELISFAPAPQMELSMPEDVPDTSARIGVRFSGVGEKDTLKFVLACVYPSGQKGDFSTQVQTHDVTRDTKDSAYTVSLENLPEGAFPLTSSIMTRLIQPYRLTAGRYRPQEPRGKAVLSTIGKSDVRRGPANVAFPRFASHFDWLLFFGGGQGKGRKSSLADSYYSTNDNPPSSNVTPPPGGGGGVPPPIIILPPPGGGTTSGGGGGPGGGGPNSNCGCGNKGENCPADQHCRGHCAPCKCQGKGGNGSIVVPLTCVTKGVGCQPDADCKCGPHTWSEGDCMNFVGALTKGAAETAWFGEQFGLAPCHVDTPVAMLRVTFWGVGLEQINQWYTVSVTFGPCTPRGKKIVGGLIIRDDPVIPETPRSGPTSGTIVRGLTPTSGTATTTGLTTTTGGLTGLTTISIGHPFNDPNLAIRGGQISTGLGGMGQIGVWTVLPTSSFSPTVFANLLSLQNADAQAFQGAYWTGGTEGAFPSVALNPNITTTWATPVPPASSAGGTPTGTTPPPTTPPPPPTISSKSIPGRR
jgi:hypothetical protein